MTFGDNLLVYKFPRKTSTLYTVVCKGSFIKIKKARKAMKCLSWADPLDGL